ncbi:hypothetical protein CG471_11645 [Sphingobium sp. IP1]|uniref:hypothetical protein n=1 Tax=Sphingobium sp. IP1 TaxID=2021637 RepID=UPI000C083F84|nr:hypothetical protein [Sphingobium sp. IP1]PHP19506.1 hypothetical protein CG471_11645 [Sphingobium sp. IP1]
MTSADMLRTSANLVRNRAGERREADPLAQLLVVARKKGAKKSPRKKVGVARQKFAQIITRKRGR